VPLMLVMLSSISATYADDVIRY